MSCVSIACGKDLPWLSTSVTSNPAQAALQGRVEMSCGLELGPSPEPVRQAGIDVNVGRHAVDDCQYESRRSRNGGNSLS